MKRIHITLTANNDGTYTVKSFSNTNELHVGQVVKQSHLDKWVRMKQVTFHVVGFTPIEQEAEQLELIPKESKAKHNGIAMAR